MFLFCSIVFLAESVGQMTWFDRGVSVIISHDNHKMSVYLRFNMPTQVSVTGYGSDVATLLSGGGDVHFRIYPTHLYQIGLY